MMKSELNPRQWALYNYLKDRGDKWTLQEQAAMDIPEYNYVDGDEDNFHDCNARHMMTNDIRAINNSGVIQKIIISGAQGIKLANKDEFTAHLKKQYAALWRKKNRLDK